MLLDDQTSPLPHTVAEDENIPFLLLKNCKFLTNLKDHFLQGDPKKMSVSVFEFKSVLDVGFDFSACVLESEFRARFI